MHSKTRTRWSITTGWRQGSRWQTLGMVGGTLLLLIAHTVEFEDDEGEVIRIISARQAERKERRRYEKARQENRER